MGKQRTSSVMMTDENSERPYRCENRGLVRKESTNYHGRFICVELRKVKKWLPVPDGKGGWMPAEKKLPLTEYLRLVLDRCTPFHVELYSGADGNGLVPYQTFVEIGDWVALWAALEQPLAKLRVLAVQQQGRGALKPELVFGSEPRFTAVPDPLSMLRCGAPAISDEWDDMPSPHRGVLMDRSNREIMLGPIGVGAVAVC